MRIFFLFVSLLLSMLNYAQIKGVVVDSVTKEPIPYVNIWIANEAVGTTSNINGVFYIEHVNNKILVFSAIGYETSNILFDSIRSTIELIPKITELDEVQVATKSEIIKKCIGKLKFIGTNSYFGCSETKPWIVARFFPYNESYKSTSFLNKVRFITKSEIPNAIFNLRLYSVNDLGEPEEYLTNDNIIGVVEKGKHITEVDISKYNIQFPEKGFFIAVEWLIVEQNRHKSNRDNVVSIEPIFGTIASETDENSWIMLGGKWMKIFKTFDGAQNKQDRYELLEIELVLMD